MCSVACVDAKDPSTAHAVVDVRTSHIQVCKIVCLLYRHSADRPAIISVTTF